MRSISRILAVFAFAFVAASVAPDMAAIAEYPTVLFAVSVPAISGLLAQVFALVILARFATR